jgi:hypothetical protein
VWHLLKFFIFTPGLWTCGCGQSALPQTTSLPDGWRDGSYTGVSDRLGDLPTPQLVCATVDGSHGSIVTIRIHQPPGWHIPQEPELLLRRMLEQPPTELAMPPPVGNESDQLLRALDDAMSKARLSFPTTQ